MNPRALLGLCLRPALAATLVVLAVVGLGLGWIESTVRDFSGPNGPVIFQIAYKVLTGALLISVGSFIGKVTTALEHLRLARTVPGLRRHVTLGVVVAIPVAATIALGYLAWSVPGVFHGLSMIVQWSACAFLFCLGLGLGGSWLLLPALLLLAAQYRFVAERLDSMPGVFSAIALLGAVALVALWHARFLPRTSGADGWRRRFAWLGGGASFDALERRTGEVLSDGAESVDRLRSTLPDLLKAGDYERFGQYRGGLRARLTVWVLGSYAFFFVLASIYARKSGAPSWREFGERVFLGAESDAWVTLARITFAVIAGMAAYITSVTFDASLRAELWHPISRRRLARVAFWARVRQNATFAVLHVLLAAVLVATFAVNAREWPTTAAVRALLLPGFVAALFAPVAQALFPRGADTFHAKANPLVQLAAGVTGGLFCLATVHGTSHWPTTALQARLSMTEQIASFGFAVLLAYAGYWLWLRVRFASVDVSRRLG